jgi:hypothetical protein
VLLFRSCQVHLLEDAVCSIHNNILYGTFRSEGTDETKTTLYFKVSLHIHLQSSVLRDEDAAYTQLRSSVLPDENAASVAMVYIYIYTYKSFMR